MLEDTLAAAREAASERRVEVSESRIWHIEPIAFDARLVAAAQEATATVGRWPAARCTTRRRWPATCPSR